MQLDFNKPSAKYRKMITEEISLYNARMNNITSFVKMWSIKELEEEVTRVDSVITFEMPQLLSVIVYSFSEDMSKNSPLILKSPAI